MRTGLSIAVCTVALAGAACPAAAADAIIIDHHDTDITAVPVLWMQQAKETLHIGYGHTSHGGQITSGMAGLVAFANAGGQGLDLPYNFFAFNNGGAGGALDLEEGDEYGTGWLDHDCGYWPNWYNETRTYLNDPSHADVNVILWSWCGQVDGKYAAGTLTSEYLTPMSQLEQQYPDVHFVYMTGHVDHADDANNKAANQTIRNYCNANGKILYDFADIESYDPDGVYYEFPHDNCDYYSSAADASPDGNWAVQWQNSHTQGVDWYNSYAAHSQPLNGNRKAYAAWALFAEIARPEPPCHLGDANRDGRVGVADLVALAEHYGATTDVTWEMGDFNVDGKVGVADLSALADNYGWVGEPCPAGADLPEPGTLALLAAAALTLRRRRR